ncbi:MAG: hypothetical protein KatS3mg003_1337 [Candidatus Nitrosocaldaceae archaeon]|nr:MAG: hypothetical protein KatS3mg003_1337 [Candidatus Nitrosocaldaceae archaeon]
MKRLVEDNGIDKLSRYLNELLWNNKPLAKRFDNFKLNIKGLSSITEILCFTVPEQYAIWNKRAYNSLIKLSIESIKELSPNKLTGKDYEYVCSLFMEIKDILTGKRLQNVTLLDIDMLLHLYYTGKIEITKPPNSDNYISHQEVIEMILRVGKGLGFETDKEVPLVTGTRVDAIWSANIGNLGELRYVFEVHIKGSTDSLLLNLLKASNDPIVQKVIAVAYEDELEKIRREANTIEPIQEKLAYWDIRELEEVATLVDNLMEKMSKLGLTKDKTI